jgi:hypothetical protein
MGMSKAYNRRKRRGPHSKHRLRAGRTGQVWFKKRAGKLHELKRKKRRAVIVSLKRDSASVALGRD